MTRTISTESFLIPCRIKLDSAALAASLRLARMIHEDFYCNRRDAAAKSLTGGELAARSVNRLCHVCLPPSRLRAPVSRGVSAVSSRTLGENKGSRDERRGKPSDPSSKAYGRRAEAVVQEG